MVARITQKSLRVDDEAVQGYIRAGGEVNDLLNTVAKGGEIEAQDYLMRGNHYRSGRLVRGIKYNRAKLSGPLQGVARINSAARHSLYVHDGTPQIYSAKGMVVPKNLKAPLTDTKFSGAGAQILNRNAGKPGGKGVTRKHTVAGQSAKPFLQEGLDASLRAQRLK